MKFCKDCIHLVLSKRTLLKDGGCSHSNNININLVTGEAEYIWKFANTLRSNNYLCGKDGKWFESKAPVLGIETEPISFWKTEPKSFWKRVLKKW